MSGSAFDEMIASPAITGFVDMPGVPREGQDEP